MERQFHAVELYEQKFGDSAPRSTVNSGFSVLKVLLVVRSLVVLAFCDG